MQCQEVTCLYMCHLKVIYVTWPFKTAVAQARGIIATSELIISPFSASDKIACRNVVDRKAPLFPVWIVTLRQDTTIVRMKAIPG